MTDTSETFSGGTLHLLVTLEPKNLEFSSSYPSGKKEIISSCLMGFGYEIINLCLLKLTRSKHMDGQPFLTNLISLEIIGRTIVRLRFKFFPREGINKRSGAMQQNNEAGC